MNKINRVAPIMTALGLWLLGNSLVSLQPAKAQEVAKAYRACESNPHTYSTGNCQGMVLGNCGTGYCDFYYIHDTKCGDTTGSEDHKDECNGSYAGTVKKDYYTAHCLPLNSVTGECGCPPSPSYYSFVNSKDTPNGIVCGYYV